MDTYVGKAKAALLLVNASGRGRIFFGFGAVSCKETSAFCSPSNSTEMNYILSSYHMHTTLYIYIIYILLII